MVRGTCDCAAIAAVLAVVVGFALRASKQELLQTVQQASLRREQFEQRKLFDERSAYLLHVVSTNALHKLDHLRDLLARLQDEERQPLADSVQYEADGGARKSALFMACLNRSPELVSLLLWANANVTLGRVDEGTTPMHVAAGWLHSEEIVTLLLAAADREGVATSIATKPAAGGLRGRTPAFWSVHYGHPATQQRLVSWMSNAGYQYDHDEDEFHPVRPRADEQSIVSRLAADW